MLRMQQTGQYSIVGAYNPIEKHKRDEKRELTHTNAVNNKGTRSAFVVNQALNLGNQC